MLKNGALYAAHGHAPYEDHPAELNALRVALELDSTHLAELDSRLLPVEALDGVGSPTALMQTQTRMWTL